MWACPFQIHSAANSPHHAPPSIPSYSVWDFTTSVTLPLVSSQVWPFPTDPSRQLMGTHAFLHGFLLILLIPLSITSFPLTAQNQSLAIFTSSVGVTSQFIAPASASTHRLFLLLRISESCCRMIELFWQSGWSLWTSQNIFLKT